MQKRSYPGILRDEEISASENYFLKKATLEVKEFFKKINIRIFHFRKMIFCATKEGY